VYFFLHVLGRSYQFLGLYGLVASLGIIFSTWLWLRLSRRHGKRLVYLGAGALYALVTASWFWVNGGDTTWNYLWRALASGIASGGMLLMGQAMLPDAIEHDVQRSGGMRREGLFAGFYTTAEKLAGAVGVSLTGAVLQSAGYVPSFSGGAAQPPAALLAIRICFSFAPALLTLLSCLLLIPYRLDDTLRARANDEPQ
jgi:GPH family glycoside/pentoside/hexuronide:cation symporter